MTYFNPVRYYIEVLRAVLLKGASFGLQQGAAMIARSEEIHEILLEPGSTTTEYVLEFLNHIFVGIAEPAAVGESLAVVQMRNGKVVS